MSGIPEALPAGVNAYGRSPDFTPESLPERLQAFHSTKAGVWGLIHVLEGSLHFRLEAPRKGERTASAGETIVIEPEVPHRVEFVGGGGRFFVEFYRAAA